MEDQVSVLNDEQKEGDKRETVPVETFPEYLLRSHKSDVQPDHPIKFPVPDDSIDLVTHVIDQLCLMENQYASMPEIDHFSHDHPLSLSVTQNTDDFSFGKKLSTLEEIKNGERCEGCAQPISGPFYSCVDCKFFIHKCCAELTNEVQHPFHPDHPLILLHKATSEFANLFLCDACKSTSNGFAYSCVSCEFYLDVFCSFLPDTLIHEAHQHPLVITQKSSFVDCNACHKPFSGFMFGCITCGFNLDIQCVSYPRLARHRCDEHSVKLNYFSSESNSDEYHCKICKEKVNIQDCWYYYCTDCDKAFHPRCICNVDDYQLIKFGGTVDLQGHPHPLTLVRKMDEKPPCCNCGLPFEGISFQCDADSPKCRFELDGIECKYCLDGFCAQIINLLEYESQ